MYPALMVWGTLWLETLAGYAWVGMEDHEAIKTVKAAIVHAKGGNA